MPILIVNTQIVH